MTFHICKCSQLSYSWFDCQWFDFGFCLQIKKGLGLINHMRWRRQCFFKEGKRTFINKFSLWQLYLKLEGKWVIVSLDKVNCSWLFKENLLFISLFLYTKRVSTDHLHNNMALPLRVILKIIIKYVPDEHWSNQRLMVEI